MNSYLFSYKVRLDDLDYMGIVGNSEWLTFLTRARIELLEKIGFPFSEMMHKKIGGVVAEANIKYLRPVYFDEQLNITIIPHSPFKKGLFLKYAVENQKKEECLTADIKIVFVDQTGRPINTPEKIAESFFAVAI